jgi:Dullard-like phosphatase family protein
MLAFGQLFAPAAGQSPWRGRAKPAAPPVVRTRRAPLAVEKLHHKTLVLDLDQTMVGQSGRAIPGRAPLVAFDGLYIYKRPHVDRFLASVRDHFDLFIFTASERPYADPIIRELCPFIDERHRLYGPSVAEVDGKFKKDLTLFNRSLNKVVMIDDSVGVHSFFPDNVILVRPWSGDVLDFTDTELADLIPVLRACAEAPDLRPIVRKRSRA